MDWNTVTQALNLGPADQILNWAIGMGGVIALGVIIYGGIRYTTSFGNPSIRQDGIDWILAAVWGLALLFGAYLILNTINPALVGH